MGCVANAGRRSARLARAWGGTGLCLSCDSSDLTYNGTNWQKAYSSSNRIIVLRLLSARSDILPLRGNVWCEWLCFSRLAASMDTSQSCSKAYRIRSWRSAASNPRAPHLLELSRHRRRDQLLGEYRATLQARDDGL